MPLDSPILQHYIYRLSAREAESVVLILDASESAQAQWEKQLNYCHDILPKLPADLPVTIYFLGSPQACPSRELLIRGTQQFQENRRRCSLINPILSTLDPAAVSVVAVLGAGEVFDIYDWLDTSWAQKLLLVSLGDSLQSGAELPELHDPGATALHQHLHTPLTAIQFSGPGFLPLAWDNSDCQRSFDSAGGCFLLRADKPAAPALELRMLLEGEDLNITREYAGGRSAIVTVKPQPLSFEESAPDGHLNEAEAACFEQARRGLAYTCPRCGQSHAAQTLHCPDADAILPPLIYPSLEGRKGLVSLCPDARGVAYYPHGHVLPLANNRALLYTDPGRAVFMTYSAGGWRQESALPLLYQLLENGYVLFL
ncbi:MAG: hypothetical protein GY862_12265 [Gammaproteobacteria bacterium]|nr:hypothetical protein [Gammaproteobacteria bacterium]